MSIDYTGGPPLVIDISLPLPPAAEVYAQRWAWKNNPKHAPTNDEPRPSRFRIPFLTKA